MQSTSRVNGAIASVIGQDEECECSHYWVIESPNGPMSSGRCKHCGERREFRNSVQVTSWESEGNHLHRTRAEAAVRRR